MALLITYPSALEYWLCEEGIPYSVLSKTLYEPVDNEMVYHRHDGKAETLKRLDYLSFKNPVHIAVMEGSHRENTERFIVHRLSANLPPKSFVRIDETLYIAGPEYCFLHASKEKKLHETVRLANDLCAIYIHDPYAPYEQRRRESVTTVEAIDLYLKQSGNIGGINKAKQAVRYCLNRSNSPMETKLAVIAMLPAFCGGYGLLKPELNYNVQLSEEGAKYLGYSSCCCDMVWEEKKLVLEYDSNMTHLDINQHFRDKKRLTALGLSGYKTISVTAEQLRNFREIENLFLTIRKALGMRVREERWQKQLDVRRKVVQSVMFRPD